MTKQKKWKEYKAEWLVFAFFAVFFIIVSYFHEPWYDEAQAWQIAKCASLKEILFKLPHYEGHPPLWHLLLLLPAKLGVPFEVGLKTVAAVPTLISAWILMFTAPFSKYMRLLIPFNYFIFYQYGIVSRPYGLMLLAILLAAMTFQEKDEKPWRFISSLLLLCLTSAYGILIAGGICACWAWDILMEYHWKISKAVWKDKRVWALFLILVVAVFLLLNIIPEKDTYATQKKEGNSLVVRILYCFFVMLPDTLLTKQIVEDVSINNVHFVLPMLVLLGLLGGALYLSIVFAGNLKRIKYFFIPFVFFAMFSAVMYLSGHHIGVALFIVLFWLWINQEDQNRYTLWNKVLLHFKTKEKEKKILRGMGVTCICIMLIMPGYWNVMACIHDIKEPYFHTKELADFLKDTGLSEKKIMCGWGGEILDDDEKTVIRKMNTNHLSFSVGVCAYFDHNIIMNLNNGKDDFAYQTHQVPTDEENQKNIEMWRKKGLPDVMLGSVDTNTVYGSSFDIADYAIVRKMVAEENSIWKDSFQGEKERNYLYVYVKKALLDECGLTPLPEEEY